MSCLSRRSVPSEGNFNPHCHAMISNGVWTREGVFLELPSLDTAAVCELFRRLLLRRLHQQERLSEGFIGHSPFLGPSRFFCFCRRTCLGRRFRAARALHHPPTATGTTACFRSPHLPTPEPVRLFASSIPLTGSMPSRPTSPDRGSHCIRYYGALANRARARQGLGKQQHSNTRLIPEEGATS